MSRSGDECVVALTDQWYITYGESEWRQMAEECLSKMNLYSEETRHGFEHTLSWLNQWACSRSFGLGTRFPGMNSSLWSPCLIPLFIWRIIQLPISFTMETCIKGYPKSSDIPSDVLSEMKQEFDYWYPLDLRVSGKDLIQNHLTFFIYNHTALMAT
ncbi:unnamed protein product [Microthlaspi erraticum]|uniref:Uncharacterized protein n=1 Tax=Microthlaspi erraticum TaxID=1685480 RepID=A0A6D2J3K8_9BRAS|nr:unnamed protein product [Microthlaspi erraticum]